MSKDLNSAQDFDRLFQEKLAGHAVAPPADMWEKVSANTDQNKRRSGLLWIVYNDSSFMLLILLLFFFSYAGGEFATNSMASENTAATETIIRSTSTTLPETTSDVNTPIESETSSSSNETEPNSEQGSDEELTAASPESRNTDDSGTKNTTTSDAQKTSARKVNSDVKTASMSSSNSAAGKMTDAGDETAVDTEESSNDEELANEDETTSSSPNSQPSSLETSADPQSPEEPSLVDIILDQKGAESAAREEQKAFKLRQLTVVEPYLLAAFEEDTLSDPDHAPIAPQDLVGTKDHEIFAGAHINFNLPLIFNQNTYGAFDGKELAYKPTFGLASGIRVGYTYKRQYGFQTGFIFYSRQGQDYDDNLNHYAAKRQVKLMYMQVPIILRYKFRIRKEHRFESPWVINLGTQIGILRSAQITYNGNEYPLGTIINPEASDKAYFKPIDVSIVLGVEKEIYFTKWLMLSVGMRSAFSGDINAKGHPVENDGKDYPKSHNFTFGFTLGLNYYMRK